MLQFLAPVVGNLIGSLFMPKAQQPQMPSAGMDISQGGFIPGSMPMAPSTQNSFNWSNILGSVLSVALGGGGSSPMMSMGGFGGGMGMGNPFATGSMLGGLGGFFNPSAAMMGNMGSGPMFAKTFDANNQMVDILNGEGGSQMADANINLLDSAS